MRLVSLSGGAFGKITTSLVEDIFTPVLGLMGNRDFSNFFLALDGKQYATLTEAKKAAPVIAYGSFITVFINFLIVAFVMFLLVKGMNAIRRAQEEPTVPAEPPADVKLLGEIRDLLREQVGREPIGQGTADRAGERPLTG
ncbi:MAG: large conductance mechanosensitive channel protein MscL [Armatimonadaceae bacterium]